jgi:hypothetical protein
VDVGNPAWWALAVSTLSLLVAIVSLTWNIINFRRAGPRLSIKSFWAINQFSDSPGLNVIIWVLIANSGRGPIDVVSVKVGSPANPIGTVEGRCAEPSLPARVDPGSNPRWWFDADAAFDNLKIERSKLSEIYVTAQLGDGSELRTALNVAELDQLIGATARSTLPRAEPMSKLKLIE